MDFTLFLLLLLKLCCFLLLFLLLGHQLGLVFFLLVFNLILIDAFHSNLACTLFFIIRTALVEFLCKEQIVKRSFAVGED